MKKGRIGLLLSFVGVIIGYFVLPDFFAPHPSLDDPFEDGPYKESAKAKDPFTNPKAASEGQPIGLQPDVSSGRIPEPGQALRHRNEVEDDYDEKGVEKLAEELAEAEEEAREVGEETEAEDEDEGLNPEEEEALNQVLAQVTLENWRGSRKQLLAAYEDGTIPQNPFVENEFWSKVGEVGGQTAADALLESSDPAFTKVLEGWGKANPQSLFDYFLELDLKHPKVQNYLAQTNNRELPFIDQFSSGILDGIIGGDKGHKIEDDQLSNISEVIDHFLENDSMKGESLMREFTERVIKDRDLGSLKEWVSGYEKPELQAATVQRVIESGAFDDEPLDAVKFSHSLTNEKAKRTGLSSAYARLASGVNGHDPNLTAQELNAMKDGMDRDFALNGFAHGLVHSDPEAALKWADSIGNASFRRVVVENISKRIKVELNPRPR